MPNRSAAEIHEKIPTQVFPGSPQAAAMLAKEVAELISTKNKQGKPAVIGLATGSTPVPFYRELIRLHKEEKLSFQKVITFNLDEYYGLPADHPESYARFMRDQLFDHIDIPVENINIPSGTVASDQVFSHCRDYEGRIDAVGGIDLQILGIGRTGHIGFNEPGSSRESLTRRITLDRVTRQDAASDFRGEENVPRFAITMGVGTILRAKKLALMAWGENKALVVAKAVEGPVTLMDCVGKDEEARCERIDLCVVRDAWRDVQSTIVEALDSVTVEEMCRRRREREAKCRPMYHI